MARVNQRLWSIPGQRTKRRAWGFTARINGSGSAGTKPSGPRTRRRPSWPKRSCRLSPRNRSAPASRWRRRLTVTWPARRASARSKRIAVSSSCSRSSLAQRPRWPRSLPAGSAITKPKRLAAVRKIGRGEAAVDRRLTAAAVNRPLALLRHLLRLAHSEWEAIEALPRIRLEKEPQGRLRWLTQEEITRLLEATAKSRNKELCGAVILAVNTGLRLGELIGLSWDRVDLSRV